MLHLLLLLQTLPLCEQALGAEAPETEPFIITESVEETPSPDNDHPPRPSIIHEEIQSHANVFKRCMESTGDKWASGRDGAEVIARAVRSYCGSQEMKFREATMQLPHDAVGWNQRQLEAFAQIREAIATGFANGLENKVVVKVVQRRATK